VRAFEIALFVLLLLVCLLFRIRSLQRNKRLKRAAFVFVASICFVHSFSEEFRWQMVPLYISLLLIGVIAFRKEQNQAILNRMNGWVAMFAWIGFSLTFLVPVASLPVPTGPYKVGTVCRSLIDQSRKEFFGSPTAGKRRLAIQIWYPAEFDFGNDVLPKHKKVGASYMQPSSDFAQLVKSPLPSILASHLHLTETHSVEGASIARSKNTYPVIIFSHGLMGGRIQNTIQCENLASHGFIVLGVDHTYDAAFSIFPDGSVVCSQLLTGMQSGPTIQRNGFEVRIRDVIQILDWLANLNESDPENRFAGKIDLNNIGLLGHSFGGSTSLEVLALDGRIKAALNMDGTTIGVQASEKPAMVMQAEHGDRDPLAIAEFEKRQRGDFVRLKILGTGHANFTDLPMLTPIHWVLLLSGPVGPIRCEKIINDYSLDFFNHYLKQEPFRVVSTQALGEKQGVLQAFRARKSSP
jgi:dienelactone hydrolase